MYSFVRRGRRAWDGTGTRGRGIGRSRSVMRSGPIARSTRSIDRRVVRNGDAMTMTRASTDDVFFCVFSARRKPASTCRTRAARAPAPRARVRSRYVYRRHHGGDFRSVVRARVGVCDRARRRAKKTTKNLSRTDVTSSPTRARRDDRVRDVEVVGRLDPIGGWRASPSCTQGGGLCVGS